MLIQKANFCLYVKMVTSTFWSLLAKTLKFSNSWKHWETHVVSSELLVIWMKPLYGPAFLIGPSQSIKTPRVSMFDDTLSCVSTTGGLQLDVVLEMKAFELMPERGLCLVDPPLETEEGRFSLRNMPIKHLIMSSDSSFGFSEAIRMWNWMPFSLLLVGLEISATSSLYFIAGKLDTSIKEPQELCLSLGLLYLSYSLKSCDLEITLQLFSVLLPCW